MNTFQLQCFISVAESLNFARAAEKLNVTQPAVTHQIHTLENELNVKLFKRSTRNVEMTHEGFLFFNDAKDIINLSQRAISRFENPPDKDIQVFSIGCQGSLPFFLLPDILSQLKEAFPNLHPRLKSVPFPQLYRLLEDEDVDAIIGFKEFDKRKLPGKYVEIKKVPIVCVMHPSHPLKSHESLTLDDLKNERLVLNDPMNSPAEIATLQGRLMQNHQPSDFYFCDSNEASVVLLEAGFGVSILPDFFVPKDSTLVRLPVTDISPLSFGIYYHSLKDNPLLKPFIQLMQEKFHT